MATSSQNNTNRGVVYVKPGVTEVRSIDYPKLELKEQKRKCNHGVILKVVATNICGSDQHMVRGRTTAPEGLVLGHEVRARGGAGNPPLPPHPPTTQKLPAPSLPSVNALQPLQPPPSQITGEVVEVGRDVEFVKVGDMVSTPFNIACGRCAMCKAGKTGVCLSVNPARPGAAYGYVDMGGWVGGQAEYVMVPYADFNLLNLGKRDKALDKMLDLTMLSDILPTGFHGCVTAGVGPGSSVYIAGAGPVGMAAAASAQLLGASCVIVGDLNADRLKHARAQGFETVDISKGPLPDQIAGILGEPEVDAAVDAVGFEARGCGNSAHKEVPAQVLNDCMAITRCGGAVGIPGLYVTEDPGAVDAAAKFGNLAIRIGLGWAKSLSFHTGQCPVMKYHKGLMKAIYYDRIKVAAAVNATLISLDDAPKGYAAFDSGVARKFVIDPHGIVAKAKGVKHAKV
jgi:glutathione-independent formaldehyde dehydrogenase